ncbi:helix-turn-helix domain-containing protein [Herbaspirillum sp. VT-16-41]|uniref:excisionase family DNA-binding protein n=1 Tax=Herbaspirillum sp. VT-16-41 TaxID=1953765 RepID=UPI0009812766|nr:helix-turn-helix domain-containing protein [Herbaspirillum sp. VT-16-41]ONN67586.1 DNA-binding protein [Herbaspirillum sp. VT-16-41]
MNSEPWVTAIDVARYLGVVKEAVCRWREQKGLPVLKIGRLWKCQFSNVDQWVHAGGADDEIQNARDQN